MPLYHAILTATGHRQRTSATQAGVEPLSSGESIVVIANRSTEPPDMAWDAVALDYVPLPAPAPDFSCSVLDFKARFTTAERQAIKAAQKRHAVDAVRDALDLIAEDMESARDKTLDRRDPRLQAGVQALAMFGLITSSRAADIIGADALGS